MTDYSRFKGILTARLKELQTRLGDIEDELDAPVNDDFQERATEREGDEVLEGLGRAGLQEAEAIRLALERLREGTFGICISCDNEISEKRLELLPHTPLCRNCAQS